MEPINYLVAGIVGTFFRPIVLSLIRRLVHAFKPSWEKTLFQKIPGD